MGRLHSKTASKDFCCASLQDSSCPLDWRCFSVYSKPMKTLDEHKRMNSLNADGAIWNHGSRIQSSASFTILSFSPSSLLSQSCPSPLANGSHLFVWTSHNPECAGHLSFSGAASCGVVIPLLFFSLPSLFFHFFPPLSRQLAMSVPVDFHHGSSYMSLHISQFFSLPFRTLQPRPLFYSTSPTLLSVSPFLLCNLIPCVILGYTGPFYYCSTHLIIHTVISSVSCPFHIPLF